jgi:hypothetical protein
MKKFSSMLIIALAFLALVVLPVAATPPQPTLGTAGVDEFSGEWNLTDDFFANMHEAGRTSKDVLSKLYLRYDCTNEILYSLVILEDGYILNHAGSGEHYIKVDGAKMVDESYGDDDSAPDFAFLNQLDPNYEGWEASTPLPKNQTFALNVHTQVDTVGGQTGQTSATTDDDKANNREIALITDCDRTAITLADFSVSAADGQATVSWETGTEIDNAGFNLYRATSPAGPWLKVNTSLIAAQGEAVSGASYSFVDSVGYGKFYYRIEDVSTAGEVKLHAPALVKTGVAVRAPAFRPAVPSF